MKMKAEDIKTFIESTKKAIQFKQSCTWRNGARFVLFELDKLILKNKNGDSSLNSQNQELNSTKTQH